MSGENLDEEMKKPSYAALALLPLALLSACEGDAPDATSCADWRDLERDEGVAPEGRIVLAPPGPGRTYPGFYSIGDVENGLAGFTEKSNGRSPPIVFTFHDWTGEVVGGGFDVNGHRLRTFESAMENEDMTALELAQEVAERGGIAAFAWDALGYYVAEPGYFLGFDTRILKHADILSGAYDPYIRHVAGQIRDAGMPIMLSPLGEYGVAGHASFGEDAYLTKETAPSICDLYGDPAWPDGPERIRDLFRHVIDIFREEGAHNVTWFMYASTNYMNPEAADYEWEHPGYYYPGDGYMDWIGQSLYVTNDDSLKSEDLGDLSFALDDGLEAWREVTDRPFYAPEFGVSTKGEESAADYLEEILQTVPTRDVAAFTYADAPLFEQFFYVPRLANFPEEGQVWNAALDSETYANSAQFTP